MTPRALRLTRGWMAAFVATTLAVLAHVAAGGQWPSFMLYVLCVALSAPVCMVLAGLGAREAAAGVMHRSRAAGMAGLGLAVLGSQTLFHVLLSLSGGYVAAADHTGHGGHAGAGLAAGPALVLEPAFSASGHAGHGAVSANAGAVSSDVVSASSGVLAGGHSMLILHVVAAAVAFVVLRYGEIGVLKAVATLLVRAVRLAVAVAMPWVSVRPWKPGFLQPLPARVLLWARGSLQYRGPPRAAVPAR